MKSRMNCLIALLLLLIGVVSADVLARLSHQEAWSYTIVSPKDEQFQTELDRYGALGWEVVAARRASFGPTSAPTFSYELILKRRGYGAALAGAATRPGSGQ